MTHLTQSDRRPYWLTNQRPLMLGQGASAAAVILDVIVIVALSIAAGVSWHLYAYGATGPVGNFAKVGAVAALFYLLPRCLKGHYETDQMIAGASGYRQSFYIWNFAFFCLLAVAFLTKLSDLYSRGAVILFYVLGYGGLTLTRALLAASLRRGFAAGWLATRRVWLVGTRSKIAEFIDQYAPRRHGVQVAGTEILPDTLNGARARRAGTYRPRLRQTILNARTGNIDDVILLLSWSDASLIRSCAEALMTVPASIHLGPEKVFERFADVRLARLGRATGLNLIRPPLSPAELLAKRTLDIVVASSALAILSPLLVLVMLAIKLDSPGPVLFRQRRHGFNQTPFRIFKFRTMTTLDDGPVVRQATRDDSRVTRVGRFLRRWNIDELPQLVNVIRGEMSIVGPRPHAMVHNDDYERRIALYARRHNVKPGITGWAQVNGLRGETDTEEKMRARVAHDLYYIDNWSLWFDLYIMAMTLVSRHAFRNAW